MPENNSIILQPKPTHSRFHDLTGHTYNRLTVLEYLGRQKKTDCSMWSCACICGQRVVVAASNLNNGAVKSCGCLRLDSRHARPDYHGYTRTSVHGIWVQMRARCSYRTNHAFDRYGGRGITVCERWRHSFVSFLEDMGEPPSSAHSLDRIDNNKGYSPENCRWATAIEQANNKRTNVLVTFQGKTQALSMWASVLHIKYATLYYRLVTSKQTPERAFTTPVRQFR